MKRGGGYVNEGQSRYLGSWHNDVGKFNDEVNQPEVWEDDQMTNESRSAESVAYLARLAPRPPISE